MIDRPEKTNGEKEPQEPPKPIPMSWIVIVILAYVLLQTIYIVFND